MILLREGKARVIIVDGRGGRGRIRVEAFYTIALVRSIEEFAIETSFPEFTFRVKGYDGVLFFAVDLIVIIWVVDVVYIHGLFLLIFNNFHIN